MTFHDAQIIKIEHNPATNELVIDALLTDASKCTLTFSNVVGWELSPFCFQNFLLDFNNYTFDNVPDSIIEEYNVGAQYINAMKSTQSMFFELNPAAGMGGFIIAEKYRIEKKS
jgi:hypothetical protein